MKTTDPPGLGFGGDGDEIVAIQKVEACFGVTLDCNDASTWLTAGDVYRSLLKALPAAEAGKSDTWDRFTQALAEDAGIDARSIQPDSLLLGTEPGAARGILVQATVAIA